MTSSKQTLKTGQDLVPPDFVVRNGTKMTSAYSEFFSLNINQHTNHAYANGLRLFFEHCESLGLTDVLDIEPVHVQQFNIAQIEKGYEKSSLRQYLSAVRMFLDACVVRGVLSVNPAKAVKLPRTTSGTGKTPVIVSTQVRQILDSIPRQSQKDLRDRALIGLMVYSFFRISAALSLTVRDYELRGDQRWLVGEEKGSKRHEMPVHPDLEDMMDEYLQITNLMNQPNELIFQSSTARGGYLTGKPFDRNSSWRMVRKRALAAGIHREIGNHSFRATGITTYLNNGGSLEDARIMANHSNSTTTKLYDRTKDVAKVSEIQRLKF